MNYIYAGICIVISIILFLLIIMRDKLFDFLFEKRRNNKTNYTNLEYTTNVEHIFNPKRYFTY